MKILLATYSLRDRTGSELFTVDLAHALASRGHEVHVHAPLLGALAEQLSDQGLNVDARLSHLSKIGFDIAHVHHNVVAAAVRAAFPTLPMVMLLHGVLPELEQPPTADLRIAKFLCVSEEVLEHAQSRGTFGASLEVVRNFVDLQRWHTSCPVNSRLTRVLVLSNEYPPEMRHTVEAACTLVGADLEHVGHPENQRSDVRPHIARVDLVLTQGRGALEAMGMGRNAVIMGPQGGDGFVDERTYFDFRKRNFSGRTLDLQFTPETLAEEMLRYDPELGESLRALVRTENEESKTLDQLEGIYQEVADEVVAPLQGITLLRESSFLYRQVCDNWEYGRSTQAKLDAVYASDSWRSTTPLRWISSLLRRA